MSLHCSFEHFEGWSDRDFILEAARVLAPGGRLCIVPLYLAPEYSEERIQTMTLGGESHARDPGSQFSRVYDPPSLAERVVKPAKEFFDLAVFRTRNMDRLRAALPPHQLLYSHFMALLVRRGATKEIPK
jgi:hypothetical protein